MKFEILNLKFKVEKTIPFIGIILLAVITRLLPHPPNFVPIGALAIFSGAKINDKRAFLLPLLAMFFSDFILGFHSTLIYVYASFFLMVLVGRSIKNKQNYKTIFAASLFSSLLFFIITNFGVWLSFNMYPKNINGFIQCYFMAIPFFRNTLLGDLFYTFSFFYGYQYSVMIVAWWQKTLRRLTA